VQTSTKARLISGESVLINVCYPLSVSPNSDESGKQSLYPDGDPDRQQNLIICSSAHCQPRLKILCKSARKFLRKVADRHPTDRQTNKQRLHNFLGGGKKPAYIHNTYMYMSA